MAYGSLLCGTLRGRLGSAVFSRKQGRQNVRAYVDSVANPRTVAQTGQRVKFATASGFYAHAVQNLFKFAFEDKRVNENDYNAFLRHNIKVIPANSKLSIDQGAPLIGDWRMSYGSLPQLVFKYGSDGTLAKKPVLEIGEINRGVSSYTVGLFSKQVIDYYSLRDGDIITAVEIHSSSLPVESLIEAKAFGGLFEEVSKDPISWTIKQMRLDVTNEESLSTSGVFSASALSDRYAGLSFGQPNDYAGTAAFAIIVSRNTPRGLKVSSATLCNAQMTKVAVRVGLSPDWWRFCADNFYNTESLKGGSKAVLKGSILEP